MVSGATGATCAARVAGVTVMTSEKPRLSSRRVAPLSERTPPKLNVCRSTPTPSDGFFSVRSSGMKTTAPPF